MTTNAEHSGTAARDGLDRFTDALRETPVGGAVTLRPFEVLMLKG